MDKSTLFLFPQTYPPSFLIVSKDTQRIALTIITIEISKIITYLPFY